MTSRNLVGLPRIVADDPPEPTLRPIRPRDEFVTAWLLLLLDGDAGYGYELRGRLEAQAISIDSAVVYRTLRRLESDGLVRSRWTESGLGPRRRSYRLTSAGTRQLDEVAETISSVRDLHDRFLDAHSQALVQRRAR